MKIFLNADRYLLKEDSLQNNLNDSLANIVQDCKKDIFSILPDIGLYLYWGIAQGKQNKPYSDLDLLVFSYKEIEKQDIESIKHIEKYYSKKLQENFSYVWIEIVTPDIYNQQKLVYSLIIQYLSIFLWWHNIQENLSYIKLNKDLWFQLNSDFIHRINEKINILPIISSKKEYLLACRRIMKKLLRTSFWLIIDKVNYFDNSIEWISNLLLEFYPEQWEKIKMIKKIANNPTMNHKTIDTIINTYFIRLQKEWDEVYKEYINC